MPNKDGTGPLGKGPKSGKSCDSNKGQKKCTGVKCPVKKK